MRGKTTGKSLTLQVDKYFDLLLILPAVLVLAALVVGPLTYTLYLSFHTWFISSVAGPRWTGLRNFAKIFSDPHFFHSLKVTAYFTFGALVLQIAIGVGLAQFLNRPFKGRPIVRSVLVLPMASTPVAISLVWRLMLHPTLGIINYLLGVIGISGQPWLAQRETVILSLILIDVWHWTPLIMLIALAGMTSVNPNLYEAGAIDGASRWQLFWHITLPLIQPAVVVATMLRFMDSIKTFDMVYITTEGGPGTASRILNLYVFDQGFRYFRMGYASFLVILMTLLIMGASLLMIRSRRTVL